MISLVLKAQQAYKLIAIGPVTQVLCEQRFALSSHA